MLALTRLPAQFLDKRGSISLLHPLFMYFAVCETCLQLHHEEMWMARTASNEPAGMFPNSPILSVGSKNCCLELIVFRETSFEDPSSFSIVRDDVADQIPFAKCSSGAFDMQDMFAQARFISPSASSLRTPLAAISESFSLIGYHGNHTPPRDIPAD